jgi:hypothetical protein
MSLKMSMAPPAPSWTTTTADAVLPAVGFRFDVLGLVPPSGQTVRNVELVTSVAVRLSTIAVAFPGIPFAPATVHTSVL